ncbi:MAG: hypothetical protein COB40_06890 [Marinosulfonomonas sp.]|nr:MAG: hypothetical protein COB40_06890 [Marinosulfonomonas sp.]
MRSSKDKSQFGKGEIRGIAASEGANNATVIADLVPTLLFSVPGGPAAAIFLGALFSFGYYPGPQMITQNPDLMFLIVWSVALASIVGAALCFAITPALARLTRIPFGIIAAPLILIMVIGAYQSTSTMGDIFMLFALGTLGWMMKHAGWPRAPALVGFVLAKPMEQYFWLANQIHGWSWLLRPGVIIIASFVIIPLLFSGWRWFKARRNGHSNAAAEALDLPDVPDSKSVSLILAVLVSGAFAYAIYEMMGFNPSSRLMPSLALLPGLPLTLFLLYRAIRDYVPGAETDFREPVILLMLVAYAIALWAIGFTIPTLALLVWMLFIRARMRLVTGTIYGAIVFGIIWMLFDILRGDAPVGVLTGLS